MGNDKYHADIERCRAIGFMLEERLDAAFSVRLEAAPIFGNLTGLKEKSAYCQIGKYVSGHFVMEVSSDSPHFQVRYLERLALFYELIGVPVDDPVVNLTKEVNSLFTYPLDGGLGIDQCHVSVRFDRTDATLTSSQIEQLERLARLYLRENLKR